MQKGVLFVCIGNSCRSIMAEAITRYYLPDLVKASSAGTYPLGLITAHTLDVLRERNIPTEGLTSKGFSAIDFSKIQLIVSLNGDLIEHLLPRSFCGKVIPFYVHDPYGESLQVFRQSLETIEGLIKNKLTVWLESNNDAMRR
jgi:protein-tyrosine-phosphatase